MSEGTSWLGFYASVKCAFMQVKHTEMFPIHSFASKPALSVSTLINTLPQCIITHGTSLSLA